MRVDRGWSQEQLAELSGLSVRTIQRIETGRPFGLASSAALARAFGVEVADLADTGSDVASDESEPTDFQGSIAIGLQRFAQFDGRAPRAQYWWFLLFVLVLGAAATALSEALGAAVLILLLLPTTAAGARRLHDTGHSGWWQLFALAPFGFVIPLVLLTRPAVTETSDVAP